LRTNFRRNVREIYPTIKLIKAPPIQGRKFSGMVFSIVLSLISRIRAPIIAGIESRKENSKANSLFIFLRSPVEMVIPERDTPGRIAIPCIIPIRRASMIFTSFIPLFDFALLSPIQRKLPVKRNIREVKVTLAKRGSIFFLKINPINPVGIVPIMMR